MMKRVLQVIVAILYGPILLVLIELILGLITKFLLPLDSWRDFLLALILLGVFQSVIIGAISVISIPCIWAVEKNVVALVVSSIIIVIGLISLAIHIWKVLEPNGFFQTTVVVMLIGLVVEFGAIVQGFSIYGYIESKD